MSLPPHSNEDLPRLLATWRVSPPVDPDFRPSVWRRINRASSETWAGYLKSHARAWALVTVLGAVAAGWVGHSAAQAGLDQRREQMVRSYLGELDPRVIAKLGR